MMILALSACQQLASRVLEFFTLSFFVVESEVRVPAPDEACGGSLMGDIDPSCIIKMGVADLSRTTVACCYLGDDVT